MCITLASCTTEPVNHEYVQQDIKTGKMDKVNIMFKTTYAHSQIHLYDVENNVVIDETRGAEFSHYYELEHGKHYIFKFDKDNEETIDNQEPAVYIYIKNVSTGKVIDDFEYEGCLLGYTNNFIVW